MTEEKVIKALEICASADGECNGCPYRDGKYRCKQQRLLKDALTLIIELKKTDFWQSAFPIPGATDKNGKQIRFGDVLKMTVDDGELFADDYVLCHYDKETNAFGL